MQHNTIEQILLDDHFYQWYLHSDETVEREWNEWRSESEDNRRLLEDAVCALRSLIALYDEEGNPKRVHAVHTRLEKAIKTESDGRVKLAPNESMIAALQLV